MTCENTWEKWIRSHTGTDTDLSNSRQEVSLTNASAPEIYRMWQTNMQQPNAHRHVEKKLYITIYDNKWQRFEFF